MTYDTKKENELLRESMKLTIRRSIRPSMQDNAKQREIWKELFELTGDSFYAL